MESTTSLINDTPVNILKWACRKRVVADAELESPDGERQFAIGDNVNG